MNEFNFEPRFPVAVFVANVGALREKVQRECRLVKEGADLVSVDTVDTTSADEVWCDEALDMDDLKRKLGAWMDEIGV